MLSQATILQLGWVISRGLWQTTLSVRSWRHVKENLSCLLKLVWFNYISKYTISLFASIVITKLVLNKQRKNNYWHKIKLNNKHEVETWSNITVTIIIQIVRLIIVNTSGLDLSNYVMDPNLLLILMSSIYTSPRDLDWSFLVICLVWIN